MQINPRERLQRYANLLQGTLFGELEGAIGPLSEKARLLIAVLEMIPLARQLPLCTRLAGTPCQEPTSASVGLYC